LSFPIKPGCDEPREYYELAARAYDLARNPTKAHEMRVAIGRHWEEEATAYRDAGASAFLVGDRIEGAINAYRKAGGEQERIDALIGELKATTRKMIPEMKPVSVSFDATEIIQQTEGAMSNKTGIAALQAFAGLYRPQSLQGLRRAAQGDG